MQAIPSLDPKLISLHYSKLCATSITPHPQATQLSKTQCLDLYGKGLACAADLQQQAVKAATVKAATVKAILQVAVNNRLCFC